MIGWLNTKSEKEKEELMNKPRKPSEEMKINYNEGNLCLKGKKKLAKSEERARG